MVYHFFDAVWQFAEVALQDLQGLLKFLRVLKPLDDMYFFKRLILRPLHFESPEALEFLKVGGPRRFFPYLT